MIVGTLTSVIGMEPAAEGIYQLTKDVEEKELKKYSLVLEAKKIRQKKHRKILKIQGVVESEPVRTVVYGGDTFGFTGTLAKNHEPIAGHEISFLIIGSDGIEIQKDSQKIDARGKACFEYTFQKSGKFEFQASARVGVL
jgi:plastocyanin